MTTGRYVGSDSTSCTMEFGVDLLRGAAGETAVRTGFSPFPRRETSERGGMWGTSTPPEREEGEEGEERREERRRGRRGRGRRRREKGEDREGGGA